MAVVWRSCYYLVAQSAITTLVSTQRRGCLVPLSLK